MNLQDIPIPVLLQQMVHPARQKLVGGHFQVQHLKSDRGRKLNGKMVIVRGFDKTTTDARLHCKFDDTGEVMKLKCTNLVDPTEYALVQNFMKPSSALTIDKDTLAACLSKAIQNLDIDTDRDDLKHRTQLYKKLLQKLDDEYDLKDEDFCFSCKAGCDLLEGPFGIAMTQMQPACAGNEVMDLRRLDIGLTGDDVTECAVCQESLKHDVTAIVVTLPCLHVFHESCIANWLESDLGQLNWNCPSCRKLVPFDMSTYRIRYHVALQKRVDEYLLSGFCAKCQIMIMERERNEPLGFENEDGDLQVGPIAIKHGALME